MGFQGAWALVRQTLAEWSEDRVSRLAASLAYYTAFSVAPLIIIAIRVAGAVFGEAAARDEVSSQLETLMGRAAADAVEELIKRAAAPDSGGTIATVLGVAYFLYAASNLFAELQDSMNTIWEVKPRPGLGWWPTVRGRLLSFAMVLGSGFLLMVSLVMSAALAAASRYVNPDVPGQVLNVAASLVVFTLIFAMIYKLLPDVRVRWRDVWIGAAATAALFTLGKFLIGMYLARPGVSVYGAAGSVAILLVWVYYSAQVLFLGAEFTQVYARRHGRRVEPEENAVGLTEQDRVGRGIPSTEHVEVAASGGRNRVQPQRPAPPRAVRIRTGLALLALIVGFIAGRLTRSRHWEQ